MAPGSSKLIIQKIEVKDRQGLVGEAPGLEPGMVVSAWNPDESWAQDALLRVNATKGVPTAELTVWSLVDVMVHPLGVHIHQQVANSLWVSQHCLTLCHCCACTCIQINHNASYVHKDVFAGVLQNYQIEAESASTATSVPHHPPV